MRYLFFDLDGTIIDTLKGLKAAVNHALIPFSYPLKKNDEVRLAIGNGVPTLLKRCFPKTAKEKELALGMELFKNYYQKHYLKESTPYKGMLELLRKLKKDFTLIVVSNKNDEFSKELVSYFFKDIFTTIQGSYLDKPKKPDPYLMRKVIDELNININDCLYIGDTPVDIETAKSVGMKRIIVTYGFRKKKEMIEQYPSEIYVPSITKLEQQIKKAFKPLDI